MISFTLIHNQSTDRTSVVPNSTRTFEEKGDKPHPLKFKYPEKISATFQQFCVFFLLKLCDMYFFLDLVSSKREYKTQKSVQFPYALFQILIFHFEKHRERQIIAALEIKCLMRNSYYFMLFLKQGRIWTIKCLWTTKVLRFPRSNDSEFPTGPLPLELQLTTFGKNNCSMVWVFISGHFHWIVTVRQRYYFQGQMFHVSQ